MDWIARMQLVQQPQQAVYDSPLGPPRVVDGGSSTTSYPSYTSNSPTPF